MTVRHPTWPQRRLIGCAVLCLGLLVNCSRPTPPEDNNDPQDVDSRWHMLLSLTSGNPPRGGIFDVAIYDQATRTRRYLGTSLPNGKFCTLRPLDASTEYRVEVYELPSRRCLLWVKDVSGARNPIWWSDSCSATPIANIHMGVQPFPTQGGCWGS